MKKLIYTDECERKCKYGKLTKNAIIEVSDDDYQHFVTLAYFAPIVEVVSKKIEVKKPERYKAYRMVQKVKAVDKMVVEPDFETEKE